MGPFGTQPSFLVGFSSERKPQEQIRSFTQTKMATELYQDKEKNTVEGVAGRWEEEKEKRERREDVGCGILWMRLTNLTSG